MPDNFAEIHARKRPLPTLRERMTCISARQVFQHSVKSARSFFFSARYTLARMLDRPTLLLQDQSHHRETPTSTTSAAEDVKDPTVSELERKLAANRTLSVVSAVAAFSLYVWYRGLLPGIFGGNDEDDDDAEYYYGDEEEEEEDGIRGRASDLLKEENEEEEEKDEDAAFTEQEDADFDGVSA